MIRSVLRLGLVVLFAAVFASTGSLAYGQGGTTQTLSGTVVDGSGAVIPGAVNAANSADSQPTDPLSDLGVAPGVPTESANNMAHNSSR